MKKYIVFGTVIVVFLAYANFHGGSFSDVMSSKWKPKGKQAYHK